LNGVRGEARAVSGRRGGESFMAVDMVASQDGGWRTWAKYCGYRVGRLLHSLAQLNTREM
jgi:hypothetical protein